MFCGITFIPTFVKSSTKTKTNHYERFVKENKIELPPNFGEISKRFSLWLSVYTDKEKKNKRFQSTYRVNKFMARKWIQKLQ